LTSSKQIFIDDEKDFYHRQIRFLSMIKMIFDDDKNDF